MQRASPLLVNRILVAALALTFVAGCGPGGCEDLPRRPAGRGARAAAGVDRQMGPVADVVRQSAKPVLAAEVSGTVVRVRDGDSIVVRVGQADVEVRLDSVDAPELAQAFGSAAKRRTSELAFGRTVRLERKGNDKYDRTLAEVFLPDGRSLNRELVSAGYAWWFRRYSTDRDLEARERQARADRRGLWAEPDPVPPWDFRDVVRGGARLR